MEDRISDFPDGVLGHILSFLTLKEAIRSALLSRRWRRLNVCFTRSDLDFKDLFYCSYDLVSPPSIIIKKNRRLLSAVDKIILRRQNTSISSSRIEKFYIMFSLIDLGLSMNSMQMKLDKWITCLAKPALAVLDLSLMFDPRNEHFSFPLSMLASGSSSSLQVLSLKVFHLSISGNLAPFSCLHSLSLKRVLLDDGVLEKILLDVSHVLKNLQLGNCIGLKSLNIKGFLHLKNLHVEMCKGLEKIDIDAPTLEVLILSPPKHMLDISSFLPCLRRLNIYDGWYSEFRTVFKFQGLQLPFDMFIHRFLTLCPLLDELKFECCPLLHTIGHFSTTMYALKTLYLSWVECMVKFEIIAPNLEKFYININNEAPIISLGASDKLMDVTVDFNHSGFPHDRVAEFLGTFNHYRAIKLSFMLHMGYVIAKELRNNLPSPLYGTKCLEFRICLDNMARRLSELVDYMLWLSPQATSLKLIVNGLTLDHPTTEIVLECVYKDNGIGSLEEGDDSCPCCNLVPLTCWRHCLKEVRILEYFGDQVDKENVKSYFLEQVENLSIIDTTTTTSFNGGLYSSYDELFE